MSEEWTIEVKVYAPTIEQAKNILLQEVTRVVATRSPGLIASAARAGTGAEGSRGVITQCYRSGQWLEHQKPSPVAADGT